MFVKYRKGESVFSPRSEHLRSSQTVMSLSDPMGTHECPVLPLHESLVKSSDL